jgi:hypothetical protein
MDRYRGCSGALLVPGMCVCVGGWVGMCGSSKALKGGKQSHLCDCHMIVGAVQADPFEESNMLFL